MSVMVGLRRAMLAAALSVSAAAASHAQTAPSLRHVAVEGTRFKVTLSDGRTLSSSQLVGATLTLAIGGGTARVRIDSVERDPDEKAVDLRDAEATWLHTFSVQQSDGSWGSLCTAGPDGRRQGFPVAGTVTPDGRLAPSAPDRFEITCTSGAQGKCIRFGYKPWQTTADGRPMRDAYNACMRMVRADYGGDGKAHTLDGQSIDIYDYIGVQRADMDAAQHFEAGWSPDGAVCVRHVRVKQNTSLEKLEAAYPRLRGRTGAICTEEFAKANGAVVFNRSFDRPAP
ncbi:MAG: hypothetical protein KIT67_16900 [Alphaproteobacteria bacterium]|nr:hypothetical protein [Alphaproteobacteria bacterium]